MRKRKRPDEDLESRPTISSPIAALAQRIELNKLDPLQSAPRRFIGQTLLDDLNMSLETLLRPSPEKGNPAIQSQGGAGELSHPQERLSAAQLVAQSTETAAAPPSQRKGFENYDSHAGLSRGRDFINSQEVSLLTKALEHRRQEYKVVANKKADERLVTQLRLGRTSMAEFETELANPDRQTRKPRMTSAARKLAKMAREAVPSPARDPPLTKADIDASAGIVRESKAQKKQQHLEREQAAGMTEVAPGDQAVRPKRARKGKKLARLEQAHAPGMIGVDPNAQQSTERPDFTSAEEPKAKVLASRGPNKKTKKDTAPEPPLGAIQGNIIPGSNHIPTHPGVQGLGRGLWPLPEALVSGNLEHDQMVQSFESLNMTNEYNDNGLSNVQSQQGRYHEYLGHAFTQYQHQQSLNPLLALQQSAAPGQQGSLFPGRPFNPLSPHTNPGGPSKIMTRSMTKSVQHGDSMSYGHMVAQQGTIRRPYSVSSRLTRHSSSLEPDEPSMNGYTSDRHPMISHPAPVPSAAYRNQASQTPLRMPTQQALLVCSDLNGTLITRKPRSVNFTPRPGLSEFLANSFKPRATDPNMSSNKFMIWTSAMPETTKIITQTLLSPAERALCIAIWSRDTLGLEQRQYRSKVQVYKKMETLWRDQKIQATHPHYRRGERWSQRNTLLIDDSVLKGAAQPHNLVHLPELTVESLIEESRRGVERKQVPVLVQIAAYIEEASWYLDVSAFIRERPFHVDTGWGICPSRDGAQKGVDVDPATRGPGVN